MTSTPASRVGRRTLLRTAATVGVGATVLAACGSGAEDAGTASGTDTPDTSGTSPAPDTGATPSVQDDLVQAAAAVGFEGPIDQTIIIATFETLALPGQRLQFGVLDAERRPRLGDEVQAAVVRADTFEVVAPVTSPTFYGEDLGPRGVYVMPTDLPSAGIHYLLVQTPDGHVGAGALNVIAPEASLVPKVGDAFPMPATPTVADPQGLAELCTREPDCTMHDVSLDTAATLGQPTVVCIATPKYCQTAVCGPVVDVVEDLKQSAPDGVTWVHVEVYVDAGNTPLPQVTDVWQLPSEPWTFLLDADGVVVDRFDGPVVPSLLAEAVEALRA